MAVVPRQLCLLDVVWDVRLGFAEKIILHSDLHEYVFPSYECIHSKQKHGKNIIAKKNGLGCIKMSNEHCAIFSFSVPVDLLLTSLNQLMHIALVSPDIQRVHAWSGRITLTQLFLASGASLRKHPGRATSSLIS